MGHGACNPRIVSKSVVSCIQRFNATVWLGARPASRPLTRRVARAAGPSCPRHSRKDQNSECWAGRATPDVRTAAVGVVSRAARRCSDLRFILHSEGQRSPPALLNARCGTWRCSDLRFILHSEGQRSPPALLNARCGAWRRSDLRFILHSEGQRSEPALLNARCGAWRCSDLHFILHFEDQRSPPEFLLRTSSAPGRWTPCRPCGRWPCRA